MAGLVKGHPWRAGYAQPAYVRRENYYHPKVTPYMPRRTIAPVPKMLPGFDPGYAIPAYAKLPAGDENARVTKWVQRGTIPMYVPPMLDHMRAFGSLGSLGDADEKDGGATSLAPFAPGGKGDPFAAYGKESAAKMMAVVGRLPAGKRQHALKMILDAVDPSLWDEVAGRAEVLKKGGLPSKVAVEKALASRMAGGLVKEVTSLGQKGRPSGLGYLGEVRVAATAAPAPAPATQKPWEFIVPKGVVSRRYHFWPSWAKEKYDAAIKEAKSKGWNVGATAVQLSKIEKGQVPFLVMTNEMDGKKWVMSKLEGGFEIATYENWKSRQPKSVSIFEAAWKGAKKFVKDVGAWIGEAAKDVWNAYKSYLNFLKDTACKALNHEAAPQIAAGASAAAGAPPQAGAIGVDVGRAVCGKKGGEGEAGPGVEAAPGLPGWVLPAAIGGGALLIVLALSPGKKRE